MAAAFILGPHIASAQQEKVIHFLVDASGSMKGNNQIDAMDQLRGRLASITRGDPISVTYFGVGPPGSAELDLCAEPIAITSSQPRGTLLAPFPELGGPNDKTAIGSALASVLATDATAHIILITDGVEECDYDFVTLRDQYAKAEIEVIQVGTMPNRALDLLELKPSAQEPKSAPASPLPPEPAVVTPAPIEQPETPVVVDAWKDANWLEKYLWLIAYIGLAASALLVGNRFGKMSIEVETAIDGLERARRQTIEGKAPAGEQAPLTALPTISWMAITAIGTPDKIRAVAVFSTAIVFGIPLALFASTDQIFVGAGVGLCIFALAIWFLFHRQRKQVRGDAEATKSDTVREPYFPVTLLWRAMLVLLLVLGATLTFFAANLDRARDAAWIVLSSNFSGALAVVASAPLLFAGARWWNFKRAKLSYFAVMNDAISDAMREQKANAARMRTDWETYRSRLLRWSFPTSFVDERVPLIRRLIAHRNQTVVISMAKSAAIAAGGDKPTVTANDLYRKLLEPPTFEGFVRAQIANGLLTDNASLWRSLADALASKNEKQINQAFSNLAKA